MVKLCWKQVVGLVSNRSYIGIAEVVVFNLKVNFTLAEFKVKHPVLKCLIWVSCSWQRMHCSVSKLAANVI